MATRITKRNNPKTIIYFRIIFKRSCLNFMKNIIDKTKNNVIPSPLTNVANPTTTNDR